MIARFSAVALTVVLVASAPGGCKPQDSMVASSTAADGKVALSHAGVKLKGGLDCKAAEQSDHTYSVDCTGTTTSGQPVTLTGRHVVGDSSEGREKPTFVATVAGKQIFSRHCLLC